MIYGHPRCPTCDEHPHVAAWEEWRGLGLRESLVPELAPDLMAELHDFHVAWEAADWAVRDFMGYPNWRAA